VYYAKPRRIGQVTNAITVPRKLGRRRAAQLAVDVGGVEGAPVGDGPVADGTVGRRLAWTEAEAEEEKDTLIPVGEAEATTLVGEATTAGLLARVVIEAAEVAPVEAC